MNDNPELGKLKAALEEQRKTAENAARFVMDVNYGDFLRLTVADAVIMKNFPDAILTITNNAEEERLMAMPKDHREEISWHHNNLQWLRSLDGVMSYCEKNGLKFLAPQELQAAQEQAGTVLLHFDTRKKEIGKGKGGKEADGSQDNEPKPVN